MATMRGWRTTGDGRLSIGELAVPEPASGEVLIGVEACGVCRTDLHVVDGDLPARRSPVVPGHEIVGRVLARFDHDIDGPSVGTRVGVPWLRSTCGRCRWCRTGAENLCERSRYTGWDADGGYAEYAVVPEAYAYRLPVGLGDAEVAPLLCAGIVGYRALRRAELPPGGRLGIYGFGASAHVVAQVAIAQGAVVHVLTRSAAARALALELGAASAGPADAAPPEPLDCGRWTRAARSPSPGSTCPTCRGWSTPRSCSGRSSCAASRPTPAPTARSSSASRGRWASGRP